MDWLCYITQAEPCIVAAYTAADLLVICVWCTVLLSGTTVEKLRHR